MDTTESKSSSSHIPVKPIPTKPLPRLPSTDLKSSNEPLAKEPESKQKSPEIPPKTVVPETKDKPELEAKPKKKRGKKKKKKVIENVGYYDDLQIIKELSPKKKTFPSSQTNAFKSNAAEYVFKQLLEMNGPKDQEESKLVNIRNVRIKALLRKDLGCCGLSLVVLCLLAFSPKWKFVPLFLVVCTM